MQITEATFLTSSTNPDNCPAPNKPEYAFIGRSNVGKSSLLNMLCNKRKLAKISGTPGKTRLINHFLINNNWYMVDLPGYGYAKLSKSERDKFKKMIERYLEERTNLVNLFVLVDSRHAPIQSDIEFIRNTGIKGIPFSIVFTKTDKLKPTEIEENLALYKKRLHDDWHELPPLFLTSSTTKTGRKELLNYIESINKTMGKNFNPKG
jgi:GTP-binding protein